MREYPGLVMGYPGLVRGYPGLVRGYPGLRVTIFNAGMFWGSDVIIAIATGVVTSS